MGTDARDRLRDVAIQNLTKPSAFYRRTPEEIAAICSALKTGVVPGCPVFGLWADDLSKYICIWNENGPTTQLVEITEQDRETRAF